MQSAFYGSSEGIYSYKVFFDLCKPFLFIYIIVYADDTSCLFKHKDILKL